LLFQEQNVLGFAFLRKYEEQMRQQNLFLFLFSKFVSQPIRGLPLLGAYLTKQIYK